MKSRPALVLAPAPALALAGVLLTARAAHADPLALRAPVPGAGVTAVLGMPWVGLGAQLTPTMGVALEGRSNSALGFSGGGRFTLLGARLGFGVEASGHAGLLYLRYAQGAALTVTVGVRARYQAAQWAVSLGAVVPMEMQLTGEGQLRLPVLGEFWFGVDAGAFWAGAQFSAGGAFLPGMSPEPVAQASLFLTVPFGSTRPPPARAPAPAPAPNTTTGSPSTGPW